MDTGRQRANVTARHAHFILYSAPAKRFISSVTKAAKKKKEKLKMRHEHGTKPTTKCVKCQRAKRSVCVTRPPVAQLPAPQPPYPHPLPHWLTLVLAFVAATNGNFLIRNLICWPRDTPLPQQPLPSPCCLPLYPQSIHLNSSFFPLLHSSFFAQL